MKLATIGMIGMTTVLIILNGCITKVQENVNIPTTPVPNTTPSTNSSVVPNTNSSVAPYDNIGTYNGKDIYVWNNIYFMNEDEEQNLISSSSLSKLKNFSDFIHEKKESSGARPDPKSREMYRDYDIGFFELGDGYQLWAIQNFIDNRNLLSLEKETLTYIVDNKDSLANIKSR